MRHLFTLVLVVVSFLVAGCETGASSTTAAPAEVVAVTADESGDGATDEASAPVAESKDNDGDGTTDMIPPAAPKVKHLKGDYAYLECQSVCRVTVIDPYIIPSGAIIYAMVVRFIDGKYITLNKLEFTGSLEFPVDEGETVDLMIGGNGDPKHPLTLLQMVSEKYSFLSESKETNLSSTFESQVFGPGNLSDAPHHFTVIRRLGPKY